jgi:hypothetical protein
MEMKYHKEARKQNTRSSINNSKSKPEGELAHTTYSKNKLWFYFCTQGISRGNHES